MTGVHRGVPPLHQQPVSCSAIPSEWYDRAIMMYSIPRQCAHDLSGHLGDGDQQPCCHALTCWATVGAARWAASVRGI